MIRILAIGILTLLTPSLASANRSIMEGVPATNNTIFVATDTSRVGISTKTPGYTLHIAGGQYSAGQGIVGGTGTVQGNAFSVGGSSFVVVGSSVGIRTNSPTAALHIAQGGLKFPDGTVQTSASGSSAWQLLDSSQRLVNTPGHASFGISDSGDPFDASDLPLASMHLRSTGASIFNIHRLTSGSGYDGVFFRDGAGADFKHGIGMPDTSDNLVIGPSVSEGTGIQINSANGNVGINTALSPYALNVGGAAHATGQGIVGGTGTVQGNAFSVGGSSFVVTNSSVGVRQATPSYALDVNGDVRVVRQSILVGSATVQNNAFSVGGSSFVVVGSSVGVRTASPTAALHIAQGALKFPDGSTMVSASGVGAWQTLDSNARLVNTPGHSAFGVTDSGDPFDASDLPLASVHFRFPNTILNIHRFAASQSGYNGIFFRDDTGGTFVQGIGTPDSSNKLLLGPTITAGTGILIDDTNGNVSINSTLQPYALNVGGASYATGQGIVGGTFTVTGNAFSVGGSSLTVVNGRVGVGTSNPAVKLDVVESAPSGDLQNVARFSASDGGGSNFARFNIRISTANTPTIQLRATSNGAVSAPGVELNFDGTQGPYFKSNGNVGIGTTSPGDKLTVDGTVRFGTTGTPLAAISTGTYSPTITPTANLDSAGSGEGFYTRIGNIVILSGSFVANPTTTNTDTTLGISLPIGSNLGGSDSHGTMANVLNEAGAIYDDAANDRLTANWRPVGVGNATYQFQAMYVIK